MPSFWFCKQTGLNDQHCITDFKCFLQRLKRLSESGQQQADEIRATG